MFEENDSWSCLLFLSHHDIYGTVTCTMVDKDKQANNLDFNMVTQKILFGQFAHQNNVYRSIFLLLINITKVTVEVCEFYFYYIYIYRYI